VVNQRKTLIWLFLGTLLLYALYLPRIYLGRFNDDALYIVGALSLWQGHFSDISNPFSPPMNKFGIGFPLLIAPFAKIVAPHWDWLKLVSVGFSMGTLVLFWRLAGQFLAPRWTFAAVALLALNPSIAMHSGTVLTEPAFIFFVLLSFYFLSRVLSGHESYCAALGLVLGLACLIRPVGVLLAGSVLAVFLLRRRWRQFGTVAAIAVALWAIQGIRNYLLTRTSNAYLSFWQDSLPYLADLTNLADNALRVLYTLLIQGFMGIQLPYEPWALGVSLCVVLLFLGLLGRGLFLAFQYSKNEASLAFGWGLFTISYLLMHVLWSAITPRYSLPLIPGLVLFSLIAVGSKQSPKKVERGAGVFDRRRVYAVLLLTLFSGAYAQRHVQELAVIWAEPPFSDLSPPEETLTWISSHTPSDAVFLGKSPLIYLRTGRKGLMILNIKDPDQLRYQILRLGITHVFNQPADILVVRGSRQLNDRRAWQRTHFWMPHWPAAFRLVYENSKEHTTLYEVVRDPSFSRAFEHYRQARLKIASGAFDQAATEIRAALATDPTLASAWYVQGVISWIGKNNLSEARRSIEKALVLRPLFPEALFDLGKIHLEQGNREAARNYFAASEEAALLLDDAEMLERLQNERLAWPGSHAPGA